MRNDRQPGDGQAPTRAGACGGTRIDLKPDMARRSRQHGRGLAQAGFTMIEILVVVGLIAIVAMIAIPVSQKMIVWARADSANEFTIRAIQAARDRAIAERRNIQVTFIAPNKIRLERQEVNTAGVTTGLTTISEVVLENGQVFTRFTGGANNTPDAFSYDSSATTFGGTSPFMFTSDGSFIDSAGDVVNGTVFVGMPNQPSTARAVTVFGVTGLLRAWKWREGNWVK